MGKPREMRKIYAIGESLVDIIFRGGQPQAANAGGSMLNSAVSLGRIGLPVSLITEYANDDVGNLIDKFLNENNVSTKHVFRYANGKTALAMAFLDEKNDAHYTFYKQYPDKRLEITFPAIKKEDILLYGSIYSITREIRTNFMKLVRSASKNGALLIYDPNFRKAHLNELKELKPLIFQNLKAATMIRASDEDCLNIFGTKGPDEAWKVVKKYCGCLVYTANADGVSVRTKSFSDSFPVRKITPVSTIGAGDNFNAGLIASFCSLNIKTDDLRVIGRNEWEKIISTAVEFASNFCLSYDNYIDLAFAKRYRSA
jgi:fructokinase